MKNGIILTNAAFESEASRHQASRMKEELEKRGATVGIRRNDFFPCAVEGGEIRSSLTDLDFCVYFDKDKYVSAMLERTGLRLFNPHAAIRACDDKMQTHILLSGQGIPMPKTLPGLLCYDPSALFDPARLNAVEREIGYPAVVKTCYGSRGTGVFKADSRAELETVAERLKCVPHLYQEYIAESAGTDVRVIVVGGECVAAMRRSSSVDFRSNIDLGGTGEPFTLTPEIRDLCRRVASALRLDYAGVDLLLTRNTPLVCEVNSNAFFHAFESVTRANVAAAYAEHILKCLS